MLLTVSLSAGLPLSAASHVDVVKMRTENRVNPLGIGTSTPRFSWQITSDRKGVVQTSYQILVASSEKNWIETRRIYGIAVNATAMNSCGFLIRERRCSVALRLTGRYVSPPTGASRNGPNRSSLPSDCSAKPNGAVPGLDWKTCSRENRKGMHTQLAARSIRKDFAAKGKVKRAVAYVAGLGVSVLCQRTAYGRAWAFAACTNRLPQDHLLQYVRCHFAPDREECHRHQTGQRQNVSRCDWRRHTRHLSSVIRNAAST